MTREEAIDCNKNLRMYMRLSDKNQPYKFLEENYIALDMAIEALKQEPCEDCISRQAALGCCRNEWEEEVEERLKSLPPVTPQPKVGYWINVEGGVECDKCGEWYPHAIIAKNRIKFCCECGAKMVEPQERSDKE